MAIASAVQVAFGLALVYGVLPRLLFKRPRIATGALDRFVIDVIRMTAFVIVVVHVLVPLRLFQVTGLLLVGAVWIYMVRLRPSGWTITGLDRSWGRITQAALYVVEGVGRNGNERVRIAVRTWARTQVLPRILPRRPTKQTAIAVWLSLPLIALLAGSLAIRIAFPLTHAAFVPADSYVHLVWTKYLSMGVLFQGGVYPQGLHSILAVVEKLSPATNSETLRFAGPFLNTLGIFLVYAVALRATRHAGASLVAAAVVGLVGTRPEVGLLDFRQVGALPQELAALLAIAGLYCALEYVARPSRARLWILGLAAFAVAVTHPVGSMLFAVIASSLAFAVMVRRRRISSALRVALATGVGTVVGNLYIPLGLLYRGFMYQAVKKVNPVGNYTNSNPIDVIPVTHNVLGPLALAGAIVGVGFAISLVMRGRPNGVPALMLSGIVLVCAAVQLTGDRILDNWYALRWTELVLTLMPMGIALGLAPLGALWAKRALVLRAGASASIGLVLVAAMVVALPPQVARPEAFAVEHESAADELTKIMASSERLGYTVVGPPAWYSRVLGSGYHIQLTDFVDLHESQAVDPSFLLPIPSKHVYVLTEKEPFQVIGGGPGHRDVYLDPERRTRMMGEADEWMQTYARFHDGVSIVREDDKIRVWRVEQAADPDYAKAFKLVKN